MRGLVEVSIRRRWLVIGLWLVALFVVTAALGAVRPDFRDEFSLPGTDSQAATDLLSSRFPQARGDTDRIVWQVRSGSVEDAAVRARIEPMLATVAGIPDVEQVISPYGGAGAPLVSADGRTAYAPVRYSVQTLDVPKSTLTAVVRAVHGAAGANLTTAVGGPVVGNLDVPTIGPRELIGVFFAAVVLYLALGSLWAMLLPLVTALMSLAIASSLLGLLSRVLTIATTAPTIAALIGVGVGIDYALFIVARHRSDLLAGIPPAESIARALNTSGRAVFFAGTTVCICLLGMLTLGISVLTGVAIGATVAVAITVGASLTLLPALLSLLGMRLLPRRRRGTVVRSTAGGVPDGGVVTRRVPAVVARRPLVAALVGLVALLALAGPLPSIRLGTADQGSNASDSTTRQAYDMLTRGFGPGFNGPLLVVARPDRTTAPLDTAALTALTRRLAGLPDVASVTAPVTAPDGRVAIVQVVPGTSPQDQRTTALLHTIRTGVAPSSGLTVHVGGSTAVFDDFARVVGDRLWRFILFVLGLSLLLLVVVFRSIAIPILGAVLNVVSAAAAFGVVVAIFQWGWGERLIGVSRAGPIDPAVPVIAFAILFGLSMDYQVFLVTRVHEEWIRSGRARDAVSAGQSATSGIIATAATIMIFVFGSFVLGDDRTVKLIGLSMAIAVLLDAFVVRQLIVPGVLHLLAERAWWLPPGIAARLLRTGLDEAPPANPVRTRASTGAHP